MTEMTQCREVCHQMRKAQVYACATCGLELQVVKECDDTATTSQHDTNHGCALVCCNEPLKLKA